MTSEQWKSDAYKALNIPPLVCSKHPYCCPKRVLLLSLVQTRILILRHVSFRDIRESDLGHSNSLKSPALYSLTPKTPNTFSLFCSNITLTHAVFSHHQYISRQRVPFMLYNPATQSSLRSSCYNIIAFLLIINPYIFSFNI